MNADIRKAKVCCTVAVLLIILFPRIGASADTADYPTKPITLIAVSGPGGTGYTITQAVCDVASKYLGQPIIQVPKPGGSGTIAVAELARSRPDGYTIGYVNMPTLAIIPHQQNLPYDPLKDFTLLCYYLSVHCLYHTLQVMRQKHRLPYIHTALIDGLAYYCAEESSYCEERVDVIHAADAA